MADREPELLRSDPDGADPAPAAVHEGASTERVAAAIDDALGDAVDDDRDVLPPVEARRDPTPAPKRAPTATRDAKPGPGAKPGAKPGARDVRARGGRDAETVYVAGFWKRAVAAGIDLAVVLPVSIVVTWIASKIGGVHLPAVRQHGADFWLDLLLASDPALMMAMGLFAAVASIYLYLFQMTTAQTLGMRVMKLRVIDVFGDPPSHARCAVRTAGYLVSTATLFLGFLWAGFDSEKRGLHDWMAGTYVIKA